MFKGGEEETKWKPRLWQENSRNFWLNDTKIAVFSFAKCDWCTKLVIQNQLTKSLVLWWHQCLASYFFSNWKKPVLLSSNFHTNSVIKVFITANCQTIPYVDSYQCDLKSWIHSQSIIVKMNGLHMKRPTLV